MSCWLVTCKEGRAGPGPAMRCRSGSGRRARWSGWGAAGRPRSGQAAASWDVGELSERGAGVLVEGGREWQRASERAGPSRGAWASRGVEMGGELQRGGVAAWCGARRDGGLAACGGLAGAAAVRRAGAWRCGD
jgi:hypothetical protein